MSNDKKNLRVITYLSPGIPVQVFETVTQYLEEVTGLYSTLIYESRALGPLPDRPDPFTNDDVDIGFMESTDYLRLVKDGNKFISLCEAGAVHGHGKNNDKPVFFTDLIIKGSNRNKYSEVHDLRGHTYGHSSGQSLSASLVVLEYLKKIGVNASFFSDLYETGSHLASIQCVLQSRVDVAAVDSNVLQGFLSANPHLKDDIHILMSLGPLPTYPIVFNSRLPADLKTKITTALLNMNKNVTWGRRLKDVNISGFVGIDSSLYQLEEDIKSNVKGLTTKAAYY